MTSAHTIIIGGGPAGLASAACMKKEGLEFIMLEKYPQVATSWRNHYDRLCLHTSKRSSALPFKKFGKSVPKYPSKLDVVDYLEKYSEAFSDQAVFNTEVLSVTRNNDYWRIETNNGDYQCRNLIIATGLNNKPNIPEIAGMKTFTGKIVHSSQYKNGKEFAGKKVLVIGFGNSGCEQAICLHEHGAFPSLSVRSAVNVLPRDIFGFSILDVGKLTSMLPARVADKINAPLIRMITGDITKLGLKKSKYGPLEQIEKQKRIPLLDVGTLKLIKQGYIKLHGNAIQIGGRTVYFEDNRQDVFDAIILATGYKHSLESFLNFSQEHIDDLNNPVDKQSFFGKDGLYFCGFYISPRGMLREIGIEAGKIAKDIAMKRLIQ